MPQKNSLPMEIPKKRVAWIDVSRVLAALLIMYVHLSSPLLKTTGIHLFYNATTAGFPSSWCWPATFWQETSPGTRQLTGLYGCSSRT